MQLTDWLVVIFVVAIVVVLLDGVRRKLAERRNRVVLKIDKSLPLEDVDPDLLPNSELPNGGARTLRRDGQSAPSLRNLKAKRKPLPDMARRGLTGEQSERVVPVLMDAVELEEERIEHTNVFADSSADESFEADDFSGNDAAHATESVSPSARRSAVRDDRAGEDVDESNAGFDEEYEEEAMLREQIAARKQQGYMDTRYQGRDDDDSGFEDEDEDEFEEEDEEFEDEFEDEIGLPDDFDDDDEEDELDEDFDDEDDDDDFDDDDEDEFEEEEDLDELEGIPEDDWGSEEEQDVLVDDYENEPVLMQGAYDKAASHFNRPARQERPRIEPGFGGESFDEDEMNEDFTAAFTDDGDDLGSAPESLRAEASPVRKYLKTQQVKSSPAPEAPRAPAPQEVIIINVMARAGQTLRGNELLQVLQQQGLRLGDMSIFHRHAGSDGSGPVMFSMANMVKPGTFDLAMMEEFSTPGVSFFMQMPNPLGNMQCFDTMLGAATAVRNTLAGELKDENRSVFTRQTVEHCRQRVRDFELRLLSRKS
jgi:cell division protein ZipA